MATKQKNGAIGVDLGTGSIKLVEIFRENQRPTLNTYAFSESPFPQIVGDVSEYKNREVAMVLKEVVTRAKVHTRKVVASLPTFTVFSSVITIPTLPPKQLTAAVENEARKVMPLDIKEMMIDWQVIGTETVDQSVTVDGGARRQIASKSRQNTKILLTAVAQKLITKYTDIFQLAGLELVSLETEIFALTRSLVGKDQATFMIVDLGASTSSVSVIEKGIPVMNRTIGYGSKNLTKFLSDKMTVPLTQAETIKKDLRPGNEQVAQVLYGQLQPVIDEVRYTLQLYVGGSTTGPARRVEKIILTGGGSGLSGIAAHFGQQLQATVQVGDPWARVHASPELRPLLDRIGPRFGVAVGLALRQFDS